MDRNWGRPIFFFLFSISLLIPPAYAHNGKLDKNGGHRSKTGGYHCHAGDCAYKLYRGQKRKNKLTRAKLIRPQSGNSKKNNAIAGKAINMAVDRIKE